MLSKSLASLLLTFLSVLSIQAQTIRGTVVDNKTNEPLLYATIGIIGTNIGTLSNDKGEFDLNTRGSADTLRVRVSMMGFESKEFRLNEVKDGLMVRLSESSIMLNEVTFRSKKQKTLRLGTTTSSKSTVTGWGAYGSGGERGIKIVSTKYPVYPKNIGFYVAHNKYDSVLLRLHIRTLKNGLPADENLHDNIFIKVKSGTGLNQIDVSQYNLTLTSDFSICLEWITAWGKCEGGQCLLFSAHWSRGTMFFKGASEGYWQQIDNKSPSIFVDFTYEE